MEGGRSTRRDFLQGGAAIAAGLAVGSTGALQPAAPAAAADPAARGGGRQGDAYTGEIRLFAGDFVPKTWLGCKGEDFDPDAKPDLAREIGDTFGSGKDGKLLLPDLRGRALVGRGTDDGGEPKGVGGRGRALCDQDPSSPNPSWLALTYLISPRDTFGRPLVGEIHTFAFDVMPRDWLLCDGRELLISQYNLLFAVIGNRFGGDPTTTFRLPNLNGYTPIGDGDSEGLPPAPFGRSGRGLGDTRRKRQPPRVHVNHCIASFGAFPERR